MTAMQRGAAAQGRRRRSGRKAAPATRIAAGRPGRKPPSGPPPGCANRPRAAPPPAPTGSSSTPPFPVRTARASTALVTISRLSRARARCGCRRRDALRRQPGLRQRPWPCGFSPGRRRDRHSWDRPARAAPGISDRRADHRGEATSSGRATLSRRKARHRPGRAWAPCRKARPARCRAPTAAGKSPPGRPGYGRRTGWRSCSSRSQAPIRR